jgi:hypothetical protein
MALPLTGARILVVEDDFIVAIEIERVLIGAILSAPAGR